MSFKLDVPTDEVDTIADQGQLFRLVFPPIMLPIFLAVVDSTIVTTALPAMAASFQEVQRISWVVVGYLVANTIAAPVYGRLADMFGRRQLMQMAIALFCAASALCALSVSLPMLVLARVLQGLGGGGLMTLSQALIGERVPQRQRGHFQGYLAGVIVFASTFGPVAGGFLTEAFGWASVFWVSLPVGLLAMWLVRRLPPAQHVRSRSPFDALGLVGLVLCIASLLLGLDQMQRLAVSRVPLVGVLLAIAVTSAVALIWYERRIGAPLIPVQLLRNPSIWRANAMAGFSGASLTALVTFLPIYLQVVGGASPSVTGYLMLPFTAGVGMGSIFAGRLISATGRTAIIPGLSFLITFAAYVAAGTLAPQLDRAELAWLIAAGGFFQGTAMPVAQITVQHLAGPRHAGCCRRIGAADPVTGIGVGCVGRRHGPVRHVGKPGQLCGDRVRKHGGAGEGGNGPAFGQCPGSDAVADRCGFPCGVLHHFNVFGEYFTAGLDDAVAASLMTVLHSDQPRAEQRIGMGP